MRKSTSKKNRSGNKIMKNSLRNRLSVFKSNNHIYAQIISDEKGITIASASSMEKKLISEKLTRKELAEKVGKEIAKRSIEKGVKDVYLDRGSNLYHGIVKTITDEVRSGGINL